MQHNYVLGLDQCSYGFSSTFGDHMCGHGGLCPSPYGGNTLRVQLMQPVGCYCGCSCTLAGATNDAVV